MTTASVLTMADSTGPVLAGLKNPLLEELIDKLDDSTKAWVLLLVVFPLFLFTMWYKWQQSQARRRETQNAPRDELRARSTRARVVRITAGAGLLVLAVLCIVLIQIATPEGSGFLVLGCLLGFGIGSILLSAEFIRWWLKR